MKTGLSALELLLVIVVLCVLVFAFSKGQSPVKSYVNERKELNNKQQIIDSKIDDIQKVKNINDEKLKNVLE